MANQATIQGQIRNLVQTTTSSGGSLDQQKILSELNQKYGDEARVWTLSCILDEIDFKDQASIKAKLLLLQGEMSAILFCPNFVTLISKAFEGGNRSSRFFISDINDDNSNRALEEYMSAIFNNFQSSSLVCAILSALARSQYSRLQVVALKLLAGKMSDLNSNAAISSLPDNILHGLYQFVVSTPELSVPEISGKFLEMYGSQERPMIRSHAITPEELKDSIAASAAGETSIASILMDFGSSCSSTVQAFSYALKETGRELNERELGELLISVIPNARLKLSFDPNTPIDNAFAIQNLGDNSKDDPASISAGGGSASSRNNSTSPWNLDVITEVLREECRGKNFNWLHVARCFDHPKVGVKHPSALESLSRLVQAVSGRSLVLEGLLATDWRNKTLQLSLLALAANADRSVADFSSLCPKDSILEDINMENGSGVNSSAPMPTNFSWLCLHLYQALLVIANMHAGLTYDVLQVLTAAATQFPEYVLLGLSQAKDPASGVRADLLMKLMPYFTSGIGARPSSFVVMRRLAQINPDILVLLFRVGFKRATVLREVMEIDAKRSKFGALAHRVEAEGSPDELLAYWCALADRTENFKLETKLIPILEKNIVYARYLSSYAKKFVSSLRPKNADGGVLSTENFNVILQLLRRVPPSVVNVDELNELVNVSQTQQGQGKPPLPAQPGGTQQQQPDSSTPGVLRGAMGTPKGPASAEIEEIANGHFQRVYTGDISIPDMIALLKKLKTSTNQKDQEIFRCMIHNLFDEYRFFHKYPEKELQVTGQLFGSLIFHSLVSNITLGIALRYVLEALRKEPDRGGEKMFRFGKIALEQFKSRLNEWPQYCSHLVQIPHLAKHCPELFAEAQKAISAPQNSANNDSTSGLIDEMDKLSVEPQSNVNAISSPQISASSPNLSSSPGNTDNRQDAGNPSPFSLSPAAIPVKKEEVNLMNKEIERMNVVNVDPVVTNMPPEGVRDQVHFIVNNIAKNNVNVKTQELKSILLPDYFIWFANYLVVKRLSTQVQLHSLFIVVLDEFTEDKELSKAIQNSVFYNVTKLLQSSKITTSSSERSVLRNLGTWLGQVTLGRNQALLQRRIDLKELLFWGYETGRLIAVSSFVAKILEGVKESKVFRPPNPWTMAILSVMRELYEIEDLKMNIKFEVQVLCNNINIRIEDITLTNHLSSRQEPNKIGNTDFNVKSGTAAAAGGGAVGSSSPVTPSNLPPSLPSNENLPSTASSMSPASSSPAVSTPTDSGNKAVMTPPSMMLPVPSDTQTVIPNLSAHIVISPSLNLFVVNPNYRRVVSMAVDRGIREMIQSVVEKCATIARTTTAELVLKDFAQEPNENNLRTAAQLMATNLAGSLAIVTCREPLRINIANHLRSLLAQVNVDDTAVVEEVVQVCCNDNLELGCKLIEKAVTERVIRDTDEMLVGAIQARRKAREAGQPFVDVVASRGGAAYPQNLPDVLKPKPGGLHPIQILIYEAFQRPRQAPSQAQPVSRQDNNPTGGPLAAIVQQVKSQTLSGPSFSLSQASEMFHKCLVRIDASLSAIALKAQGMEVTFSMLGNNHEIFNLIKETLMVCQKADSTIRVEASLASAERMFRKLLETVSVTDTLRVDVFTGLIGALKDMSGGHNKFSPDVFISWMNTYSTINLSEESGKKTHRYVVMSLLKSKLVRSVDVDVYFANNSDSGRNMIWVEHSLSLVRQCLAEGVAATYEFAETFDMVSKMRPTNPAVRKQLQKWLTDLRVLAASKEKESSQQGQAPTQAPTHEQAQIQAAATTASKRPPTAPTGGPAALQSQAPMSREALQLREHVTILLENWIRVWQIANDKVFAQFLQLMHQYQVLKTEDAADRFFKVATELCVEACLKTGGSLNYDIIDALCKLFLLLVRLADKEAGDVNVKNNLLTRILTAIARALSEEHELRKASNSFDQRPYYRLLFNLSSDMEVPNEKEEPNAAIMPLLTTYSQIYLALQPATVPGFAFGWLKLISQNTFMPHLLLSKNGNGPQYMQRLLVALLQFLEPLLSLSPMSEPVRKLYKGTLRVLLVLLHDFPGFLCSHHLALCEAIPAGCVQMRNLVLSAYPKAMRPPNPLSQNLDLNSILEVKFAPPVIHDFLGVLNDTGLRQRIDSYLNNSDTSESIRVLTESIQAVSKGQGVNYNTHKLMNSLVIYVASQSTSSSQVAIIAALLDAFDAEYRYALINSMINQLRYPNSHTHFFMNTTLHFFTLKKEDGADEFLMEQFTRVLLERLIVHRPHPWGLLVTFIELIKSPKYAFWSHPFTKCDPAIEKLFESVSRSCMQPSG